MSITISITGDTPELIAAHVAWLGERLGSIDVIKEVRAKREADKAVSKARVAVVEVEPTPAPAVDAPSAPSEQDKSDLQKLASAKSKIVGVSAVKDAIAKYGGKNINDTPADKFVELKAALEALA